MAVALVTRKSTRDEAQVSVTRQEKLGREWAAREHPGVPVLVFSDNAVSGVKMDREGWQAFVDAVRRGAVDVVWAYEQSRLTRAGSATWDEVCFMLTAAGVAVLNTHTQGSIGVAEGQRLAGRMQAVVDQEYRERARINTLDGLKDAAERGRPSGATGYGYRRVREGGALNLEPDPGTAPVVARMVAEVAAGSSLGLVAAGLNAAGIPTPRGSRVWRRESVKAIVTAPRIVGDRVHQGKVIGPAAWPGIVERSVWLQAQAAIGNPKRRAGARRRYLLTGGLAVCDACGTPLISASQPRDGRLWPAYACPHPSRHDGGCGHLSVLADRLEAHVIEVVGGWLDEPGFAAAVERLYAADQERGAPLRAELAAVDGRLTTLAEQWAAGGLLDVEHAAARRVLVAKRGELAASLRALPPSVDVTAEDIRREWDRGAVEDRRPLIDLLTDGPIRVARGPRTDLAGRVKVRPSGGSDAR